jgi:hypothetical protein
MSASIIAHLAVEQVKAGLIGDVAEIGVHHGKLFVLLANSTTSEEMAHAVDVFSDEHKNLDGSGAGDRGIFESNIRKFASGAKVNIIQESSLDLERLGFGDHQLRLLSIDGGHTAAITYNDLRLAERCMVRRGIAILDDVFNPEWLGVITGLADYFHRNGSLRPFAVSPNKVYFSTDAKSADFYREILRRDFPLALQKRDIEFFGTSVDCYSEHPYYDRVQSAGLRRQLDDLKIERDNIKIERDSITTERDNLKSELSALNAQLAEQVQLRDNIKIERDNIKIERDNLKSELSALNAQLAEQVQLRDNIKIERDSITTERDNLKSELSALNAQLAEQVQLRDNIKIERDNITTERDNLKSELSALNAQLADQDQQLEQARRSRDEILQSSSWKITGPLRRLVFSLRRFL